MSELRKLPSAYVPVIKMRYRGIEVDLTMARIVCYDRISNEEEFLVNSSVTHDMMPECLRSFNGYRATLELLKLVPNIENFKLTLRVIKLWAKKNGLYGNMIGFLGGASWAILVAKVCQMTEGNIVSISSLILQFFGTFANWEWPKPVYIKRVDMQPFSAWNPAVNPKDREHVMPIITSTVPQMNSAVNMSKANCQLIKSKFAEAVNTLQGIINGSRSWSDLFQPSNFFEEYDNYVMVSCSCLGESSLWFGTVETKLRGLTNAVSGVENVLSARIWPQPFVREGSTMRQMWFIGLKMIVGHPAEKIQDPMHHFTNLCMGAASELNSVFSRSFMVSWQHLTRAQLGSHLSKQQISMGRVEKPSYAAVTMGGAENTLARPMTMTPYPGPILSPGPSAHTQADFMPLSHPPPYNRVFSTGPLNGFNGVVPPHHNYIVYSTGPLMPGPGQINPPDQYHNGGVAGGAQKLTVVTRPPSHMLTFPPNRSLRSPQPGGYPNRTQPLEKLLRGGGGPIKSPQTPAGVQMLNSGPSQPQRNSRSPGPGSAYVSTQALATAAHGSTFPHPIPNLTSYPPPPISPMAQFNSPPPAVAKIIAPPQTSNQRQEPTLHSRQEDNPPVHLRVPIKKNKVKLVIVNLSHLSYFRT